MALTPKQAAFVREYLVDLNATRAAIRAGFPAKSAASQASRLLKNAKVRQEIDKAKSTRAARVDVKADEILRELMRIGYSDPGKLLNATGYLLPLNEVPEEVRRTIASVEMGGDGGTKIKFWPKTTALELLGKHLKLFTDKTELTGADGGPVQVSVVIDMGAE